MTYYSTTCLMLRVNLLKIYNLNKTTHRFKVEKFSNRKLITSVTHISNKLLRKIVELNKIYLRLNLLSDENKTCSLKNYEINN